MTTSTLAQSYAYPEDGGTGTTTLPIAGQVLIGFDGDIYGPAYLIGGTNVTIATTSGGITISSSAAGGSGTGQWSTSTGMIYYEAGVVLVGGSATTTGVYDFEVIGSSLFDAITASGNITGANLNIANWDSAYSGWNASNSNWDLAHGWGDHSLASYLTTVAYGDLTGNPSDVITAGTLIDWSSDTLNVIDDLSQYSNATSAFITTSALSGYWDADGDIAADEISESKIAFSTACAAGNHYYLNGNDLACEADDNTTYTGGTNLTLDGTTFNVDDDLSQYDNATSGFLTSYSETDPVFVAASSSFVLWASASTTNWDTAYSWGDWSGEGFITTSALANYMQDEDVNTFSELQAWVSDEVLLASTSINTFAELNTIVADKTLINEEDAVQFDSTVGITGDLTVGDDLFVDVSTGEVGIGLADPLARLHVNYPTSGDVIFQAGTGDGGSDMSLKYGYNGYGWYNKYLGSGSGDGNEWQLWSEGANGTDMQVYGVKQSGNITFNKNMAILGTVTLPTTYTGVLRADSGLVSTTTVGSGTVTSVAMSVPTGLTIGGSPITTSGTLALDYDAGYAIPLSASTTEGSTAYSWGDWSGEGFLTTVDISDDTNLGTSTAGISVTGDDVGLVLGAIDHDALLNFVANEHLDWTASAGTIHTDNYIENPFGATIGVAELVAEDFGDFTVAASSATLDASVVADNEIDYANVTLADFTNDGNYATTGQLADGCTDCLNDGEIEDIYLHDGANDTMTGILTADGLTLGANENITLGSYTLDHNGTDFVFNDTIAVSNDSISAAELNEGDTFTWTGTTHSFSGVTNFLIPAVANSASEIAIDTTNDDQFVYYGDVANVLTGFNEKCFSLENASTGDDDIMIWHPHRAITITDVYCKTDSGTTQLTISDGTNALELIACDADGQADDGSIANGAFTANEEMQFDIGTVSVADEWLNVCITYTITAD